MPTPAVPCTTLACRSFAPGHTRHPIHASRLASTPWGWREATVRLVHEREVIVEYPRGATAVLWHHRELADRLAPEERVRVHEEFHALAADHLARALNVVTLAGALGDVAAPADRAGRPAASIIDLTTGDGVA